MKGVRFTKAEVALLEAVFSPRADGSRTYDWSCFGKDAQKHGDAIVAKVRAAREAPSGVAVKPIEEALIKASHGKVLALEGGHGRASRMLTAVKATVEDAVLIGAYMARSTWLTSPMTVLDVANKWNSWLPKARATAPPPSLGPGLGTGQGPAPAGKATPGRRPPQGFR